MVRPQDLILPYSKSDPRIVFHDSFWSMHPLIDPLSFVFPGWDTLFNRSAPVVVEYCSGHGHWIIDKAKKHPHLNWLAVDKRFDRARKIWSKIKNEGIPNCVVACADGMGLTSNYFPNHSVQEVYINFPDPWPKNRHAKHRIIDQPFLGELERILTVGGTITFATDDERYSLYFIEQIDKREKLAHLLPAPHYCPLPDDYGVSFFETLFREEGKKNRLHKVVLRT